MVELGEFPTPRHEHCARMIARKFSWFDSDDVHQDALIAIWRFDERFRAVYDDIDPYFAGCYVYGVRGAIDGIRRRHGRTSRPVTTALGRELSDAGVSVEDLATGLIDIYAAAARIADATHDPRIVTIVHRLNEGATKDTIAHELHIHPARVSQLLRPLKRQLEAAA